MDLMIGCGQEPGQRKSTTKTRGTKTTSSGQCGEGYHYQWRRRRRRTPGGELTIGREASDDEILALGMDHYGSRWLTTKRSWPRRTPSLCLGWQWLGLCLVALVVPELTMAAASITPEQLTLTHLPITMRPEASTASLVNRTGETKHVDERGHDNHFQSVSPERRQIPLNKEELDQSDEPINKTSATTPLFDTARQLNKRSQQQQVSGLRTAPGHTQLQQLQFLQQLRISETDLLPLDEFDIRQPAFSEIMKSWPPTTTKQKVQLHSNEANHNERHNFGHHQRHRDSSSSSSRRWRGGSSITGQYQSSDDPAESSSSSWELRNYLNEDYDDTIVTADESFEQDQLPEPPTWVNYLGELGDFIHVQLSQLLASGSTGQAQNMTTASMSNGRRQRRDIIEDLLDDFYYDQYENSQVLYYGPQLVRQGDIFEIGCYLPNEQPAEWTKSGRSLLVEPGGDWKQQPQQRPDSAATPLVRSNPLRLIKRTSFMGAKQNYSLKVFEAQLSDSGNYRCNRLSRKFHKLVVVPAKVSLNQQYLYQQRLLSVVAPSWSQQQQKAQQQVESLVTLNSGNIDQQTYHVRHRGSSLSQQEVQLASLYQTSALLKLTSGGSGGGGQSMATNSANGGRGRRIEASGVSGEAAAELIRSNRFNGSSSPTTRLAGGSRLLAGGQSLVPSQLIHEHRPLSIQCQISDEQTQLRLSSLNHFQLSWYKNGKPLRGSGGFPLPQNRLSQAGRQQQPQAMELMGRGNEQQAQHRSASNQRVQFLGANGRQLYISSANYADAGLYMCSWARLEEMQRQSELDSDPSSSVSASDDAELQQQHQQTAPPQNPAAAASQHQLVAPVKLRPFKSAYHVRSGSQLRLVCQVQRGYPAAFISWYAGNQLLDGDYLRDHPNEFRILQWQPAGGSGGGGGFFSSTGNVSTEEATSSGASENSAQIVEINPIPAGRQQMQLTANGRGQWIEFREMSNEKYNIDTTDKQLRYLQMKLLQLTGSSGPANLMAPPSGGSDPPNHYGNNPSQQAGLSVLVINELDQERHSSRFACRATGRANTDEVTTVIRVKDSATIVIQPSNKAATLIPGQPLHFECAQITNPKAQFIWLKRSLSPDVTQDVLLEPNTDDSIEIHNERLTLLKPTYQSVGDYTCQALDNSTEFEVIRVRAPPYVEDFGIETSHTGKSAIFEEGERLELTCRVPDKTVPVNISWVMSDSPDSDYSMNPVAEYDQPPSQPQQPGSVDSLGVPTFTMPNNVMVERVDSFTKRLIVRQLGLEHRGYYTCIVDNDVTERTRKAIYIRVKDKILPLWPFLGILAELFILFTIIYVWETQKAQKELGSNPKSLCHPQSRAPTQPTPGSTISKRPASGPSSALESVPLNS